MSAGLERVKRKLRAHAKSAVDAARAQARIEGETIAQLARSFAPQQDGELIRSIRVEDASVLSTSNGSSHDFIGVVVKAGDDRTIITNHRGVKFQNAKLQETGTQNMEANPYFNPAKRMRARAARNAINRAVRNGWRNG